MSMKYLIGVDLGTSSTKAALFQIDGKMVAESAADVPIYYPEPGVVEQENEDFYRTAAQTVKNCIRESDIDPKGIVAIAFDSQMAGVGAVDENFESVSRFDSWLDMRCEPYIKYLEENFGELITTLTGCPPTCDHGPKILWWQNERPEEYQQIAKFIMPGGYVAGKMAGLKADQAFIDHTYVHFSALSNALQGDWSQEICDRTGVDMDRLPQIVEPWHVVGEVTAQAASDFGLAPGTLIAAGCGDTAAGALGAGIVKAGMLFDTAGTASVLAGCTEQFAPDIKNRALLTMRSVIPGLWHPLAYIAGGGQALTWFRDQFFDTHYRDLHTEEEMYTHMEELAEKTPLGADGLYFSPHLTGRICPATPEMRGAWIGFSFSHNRGHFYRAILESIAYEYAYYLQILKELIPRLNLTEARAIGGGARSGFWNQIKADVLDVPYVRLDRSEFGTWGSAMIAGKAAGIFDDLAQVAYEHAQPAGHPLHPDRDRHQKYRKRVGNYIQLQKILASTFHDFSSSRVS
ncbi:MAG: xylulokinase [Anaerolineales bacterium]|jgi:xylulokinase